MRILAVDLSGKRDRRRAVEQMLRLQLSLERSMSADVAMVLKKQLSGLADDIEGRSSAATLLPLLDGMSGDDLRRVLMAYYRRAFDLIGKPALDTLEEQRKKDHSIFDVARDRFISAHAATRANGMMDVTKAVLREILLGAVQEGLSISSIAQLIRDEIAGDGFLNAARRAFVIARTEIHTASTTAMEAAVKASGYDVVREWATVVDGRQRESHEEADGQQRGNDEAFDIGGESMAYPGDPGASAENVINCRCQILYTRA